MLSASSHGVKFILGELHSIAKCRIFLHVIAYFSSIKFKFIMQFTFCILLHVLVVVNFNLLCSLFFAYYCIF